jgi:hypothetical protein
MDKKEGRGEEVKITLGFHKRQFRVFKLRWIKHPSLWVKRREGVCVCVFICKKRLEK